MDSDFPFELLGSERFQRLAQVLIAAEFSDTQAFPLRGPDGGRDMVAYLDERRDAAVFQVKYVERPEAMEDPHKWVLETVAKEAPKIAALLHKRVGSFTLVTNVRGTGHGDTGSIDKLEAILAKALDIPARGWWRDDLVTRLKARPDLRWEFPDLLSGLDVIRTLIESDLTEEKTRRSNAITAYLSQQFDEDSKVRFKQVDLQEDLLQLFVDIPASISVTRKGGPAERRDLGLFEPIWFRLRDAGTNESRRARRYGAFELHEQHERIQFPCAELLLDGEFQERAPFVVIEGAPGQGKSTITQYVCQIHRMRLLRRDTPRIPAAQLGSPLRLPFRVDLRDLAAWFQGRNPFSPDDPVMDIGVRSVEAFLAASVSHNSGGVDFDVADLLAVLGVTAAVAVFDGLDEVADIETRKRIVDELTTTSRRLAATSLSFQMVVTSRPAAFANSPGFDGKMFRHMALESITPEIATEYSAKWIAARQLNPRDAHEVRRVLKDKLEEAHMRELSRNTMQLTILLSLIYSQGSSLPDKRTALYGAYIETFLNREAEKSEVVREYRDLLISLHGYLAWVLHVDTERGSGSGRISSEDLISLLSSYLEQEGHDTTLVDRLFEGVVDRVVAVVSRIEGLYEFEVQPLREYFAARFLYETARYSPTGGEVTGTLPDRFVGLARNPYWLNVARFYAGFWSKGEIPSLVEALKDLADVGEFSYLLQPRLLASMLLSDWVFSQNPRSLDEVVGLVGEPLSIQASIGDPPFGPPDVVAALPDGSGRPQLVDLCFEQLEQTKRFDFGRSLCQAINVNCPVEVRVDRWLAALGGTSGADRARWLTYGRILEAIQNCDHDKLELAFGQFESGPEPAELLASGQGGFLESEKDRAEQAADLVLSGARPYMVSDEDPSILNRFAVLYVFPARGRINSRRLAIDERRTPPNVSYPFDVLERCAEVVRTWENLRRSEEPEWHLSMRPWETFVETSRSLFGERWAHYVVAIEAGAIRSSQERAGDAGDLFDPEIPLVRRARYARLRAGNHRWWEKQLERAPRGDLRLFALASILSRASPRTIAAQVERLDHLVKGLSAEEFNRLVMVMRRVADGPSRSSGRSFSISIDRLPADLSLRMVELLSVRASRNFLEAMRQRFLRGYAGKRPGLLDVCIEGELIERPGSEQAWMRVLPLLRRMPLARLLMYHRNIEDMPITIAREICSDAGSFQPDLVYWAEKRCFAAAQIEPVSVVAERQDWFGSID